jgi:hypothetical protein
MTSTGVIVSGVLLMIASEVPELARVNPDRVRGVMVSGVLVMTALEV